MNSSRDTSNDADHVMEDRKPKKPLRRWDPQDVVTLYAAAEGARPMIVHKDIACYYSHLFKTAFNGTFEEGITQIYRLADTTEEQVELLIHWLYTQEVDIGRVKRSIKSKTDQLLVELWILADRLFIPGLQNAIMRELERLRNTYKATSTSCLSYVWQNTIHGSKLREWFLHHCTLHVQASRYADRPEHFPQEMLLELVQMMKVNIQEQNQLALESRDPRRFEVPDFEELKD